MITSGSSRRVGAVCVRSAGSGDDAVLFLHAGIADSRMWAPQWRSWQHRFRLTAIDLRGFGCSDPPQGTFTHAEDVVAVLDALEIGRTSIVAASFGALVALDLTVSHPARVERLVLAAPPLPGQQWSAELERYFEDEERLLEAGDLEAATGLNVRFWLPGASAAVQAAVAEQQRRAFELQHGAEDEGELLTPDLVARLGELSAPVLLVTGEHDRADFLAIAARLAGALPAGRQATIRDAAHLPSLEQPAAFDAVTLPFLLAERVGTG